jgi:hypothetical protein
VHEPALQQHDGVRRIVRVRRVEQLDHVRVRTGQRAHQRRLELRARGNAALFALHALGLVALREVQRRRDGHERGEERQRERRAAAPHELREQRHRPGGPGEDRLVGEPAPEIVGELGRRRVAAFRVLLHRLQADHFEVAGHVGLEFPRPRRLLVADLVHHRRGGGLVERAAPDEGLVQRDAERVDVRAPGQRQLLRGELLGGHVGEGAEDLPRRGQRVARRLEPREAEVGELHRAGRGDEDVRGLHVAVQDAVLVGEVQRARGVRDDLHFGPEPLSPPGVVLRQRVGVAHGRRRRRRAREALRRFEVRLGGRRGGRGRRAALLADDVVERAAFDELHRDERPAFDLAEVEHLHDAGVHEARGRRRLAAEALGVLLAFGGVQDDLERDAAAHAHVAGLVNDAHASAADLADDLEVPDTLRFDHGGERGA